MKTEVEDIEHLGMPKDIGDADSGPRQSIECPNCLQTVKFAKYQWWDSECQCGEWELKMVATLEPFDKTE